MGENVSCMHENVTLLWIKNVAYMDENITFMDENADLWMKIAAKQEHLGTSRGRRGV